MKKLLLLLLPVFALQSISSQTEKSWMAVSDRNFQTSKNIERLSFPTEFKMFSVNPERIQQLLQNAPQRFSRNQGTIVELPNAEGNLESFELFEASNFTPELQAQFPMIRAYAGKGIDDPRAVVRMSAGPKGIQAMVFRTDKRNEFIEPFSQDGRIYAVYNSSRNKGSLPFTCSTEDHVVARTASQTANTNRSNTSELLTFRLALSCNAEYTAYFGGTIADALEGMNGTMTRVNGVFEADFAIHMTMVPNTEIIYTNAATDPYTSMGQWNNQLQSTLTSVIGEANYDVGHMFGATGGGGNAGCIGCVCVDGSKGRGITSPADAIPMGDNFDIDYVAHELGHQFGGNHTFSTGVEGTGVNVEPGSGSTIMGYAGITSQDIANHSDDYFVYASIMQVQENMVGKTCPVRTTIPNIAPVVDAGSNYTIPKSTPFALTGSGTDANGDLLTYCWEQNDTATTQTGGNSPASPTKTGGPNWRSYDPVSSPTRYFPPLARVVNNQLTSVFGSITTEAVSSVARTLNFTLTGRDNVVGAGQTNTDFMTVTVNGTAGPFLVTSPNTNVSIIAGSSQNVTWDVAGTTSNGVNAASVDIYLSTDGGLSYPITLASQVPNDGSETITFPDVPGTTNRVMVKGYNHVFYDISNTNFTITTAATTFTMSISGTQTQNACQGTDLNYSFMYDTLNGFSDSTSFTVSGAPAGTNVVVSPSPITVAGMVNVSVTNTAAAAPGSYSIVITGTSGSEIKTITLYLDLFSSVFNATVLNSPADGAITQPTSIDLTWTADSNATSYDVEVASDAAFTTIISSGNVTTNSYSVSGLAEATTFYWRVLPKNASCDGTFSSPNSFQTGQTECTVIASTNVPITISATGTPTINSTLVIPAGSGVIISDLNATLNISHTWVNDIVATLISPAGTQVRLLNQPCDNQNDVNATFDDSGIAFVCANNPAISGTIMPFESLSTFNGENSEGTWTLRVYDAANQDGGTLNSWSLDMCTTVPLLGIAENVLFDFVIYPNPNSGTFNIQFQSDAANEINIGVHDIRGREIFSRSYKNNGLFNETLLLSNASSGIYMVTVQDGDRKQVRKIVIQ